jgi:DNA-binding HxlR family transcriptional regulator
MSFEPARSAFLVRLCHHRWTIPVAAEVARRDGARFVELQHALGINPVSLRSTLEALRELRLIRRNPGYGHPLRPEYLPTEVGGRIGPALHALTTRLRDEEIEEIALRKWSLPLLDALAGGLTRFRDLESALDGITPRALAQAMRDLTAAGLVARRIEPGFPPVPRYSPTGPGVRLARRLRAIFPS